MRECVAAIIILIVIISFCLITTAYTTNFCNEMSSQISACAESIKEGDWISAEKYITTAGATLTRNTPKIKTFSAHQELSDIHSSISKLKQGISFKKTDICISESETIKALLKKISEYDNLNIENIL